jgi:hypothetical protein
MQIKIVFLVFLFLTGSEMTAQKMDSLVPPVADTVMNQVEPRIERKPLNDTIRFDPRPLLELQKQNEKKQRQGAFTRIAIGVGMLVILIIGLTRKKKVKEEN